MPQFKLICTDDDQTTTIKEFEATILQEVVEKTTDFLHGVGYVFEELEVRECIGDVEKDSNVLDFMLQSALRD